MKINYIKRVNFNISLIIIYFQYKKIQRGLIKIIINMNVNIITVFVKNTYHIFMTK